MLTIIIDGQVERQFPATMHERAYWLRCARENSRDVQVWETGARASYRLN